MPKDHGDVQGSLHYCRLPAGFVRLYRFPEIHFSTSSNLNRHVPCGARRWYPTSSPHRAAFSTVRSWCFTYSATSLAVIHVVMQARMRPRGRTRKSYRNLKPTLLQRV